MNCTSIELPQKLPLHSFFSEQASKARDFISSICFFPRGFNDRVAFSFPQTPYLIFQFFLCFVLVTQLSSQSLKKDQNDIVTFQSKGCQHLHSYVLKIFIFLFQVPSLYIWCPCSATAMRFSVKNGRKVLRLPLPRSC